MGELRVGAVIAAKRKEKGITQEELAGFLGVSKPAVSKWESGQCYPDITLLPVIATYFGIRMDELMGYEPQLTADAVKRLYEELCRAFASEPFDAVYARCREIEKKYYSCWNVLFHLGLLYVNHCPLAQDGMMGVLEEALRLFRRVSGEGDDRILARRAVSLESYTLLALGRPTEAIDLLEGEDDPIYSDRMLLVKAYYLKGDINRAKTLLQGYLYGQLIGMIGALPDYVALYADEPAKMKEGTQRILAAGDLFEVGEMHPTLYVTACLAAAQVHAEKGRMDEALTQLEEYVRLLSRPGYFLWNSRGTRFLTGWSNISDPPIWAHSRPETTMWCSEAPRKP